MRRDRNLMQDLLRISQSGMDSKLQYLSALVKEITVLNQHPSAQAVLGEWGVEVGQSPVRYCGRLLPKTEVGG